MNKILFEEEGKHHQQGEQNRQEGMIVELSKKQIRKANWKFRKWAQVGRPKSHDT